MEEYYSRLKKLNENIDNCLGVITGNFSPYTDNFRDKDYLRLKTALQDLNNILTLKLSFNFLETLSKTFNFSENQLKAEIDKLDKISPNSKGFDINISEPEKILAEVKCITPIKGKNRFNAAQKKNLFIDAYKLKYKKAEINQSEYYKFLVIQDFGTSTDLAIEALLNYKSLKLNSERTNRMEVVNDLIFLKGQFSKIDLNKDKIYIIKK